jgi:hypothetical protein
MLNENLVELELDPEQNLEPDTFRIVDIRGEQYGTGVDGMEYAGIFPMIVSAPMALYFQGKIQNTVEFDEYLKMIDLEEGIEMSTTWYRQANPVREETKMAQSSIVASIDQAINFDTKNNKFHRSESFQDACVKRFPMINMLGVGKLDKTHIDDIGILVCGLQWDEDQQNTKLAILESFVGKLGRNKDGIDRKINSKSRYIRMYKNLSIPKETDFFVIDHQKIVSLGMEANECGKYINYKTSIIDPITFTLESIYSDVDSI